MLADAYPAGTKVLLHGDGPWTVESAHIDEKGLLVYALAEMPHYFWPALEVTKYEGPPKVEVPKEPLVTEDTPEKLQLLAEVAAALEAEAKRQDKDWTTNLNFEDLGRAAMDAIMKRLLLDMAHLNMLMTEFKEETKDGN